MNTSLKAPFPWFGGKSRAAPLIWEALGTPNNYVEPFAGSLAALLYRPIPEGARYTETVNDLDCYLANFWRSLSIAPEETARWCDSPVNEADLSARHTWLVNQNEFRERMKTDPVFYDPKVAGWWVWGLCAWIGSGWCKVGDPGQGVNRQLPHLGDPGQGVNRQLPHLGNPGRGTVYDYFDILSSRLRRVRVACGDWRRITSPSCTTRLGLTGVLLDPPYDRSLRGDVYSTESDVSEQVREWAIKNGNDPKLRIVLCGYSDEHSMPGDWRQVPWKASKGYAAQGVNQNDNRDKETLFLSPACLPVEGAVYCDGRPQKMPGTQLGLLELTA